MSLAKFVGHARRTHTYVGSIDSRGTRVLNRCMENSDGQGDLRLALVPLPTPS